MASRFLFNETLWSELSDRVPNAKTVRAAVAYLGKGASTLLSLKKGDKLVVDMSLRAVRSGTTDPREVRKFLRRGVDVFSRDSLHAKFFIIDGTVIAGSANISGHARNSLDEAAVLTDDGATVRRALATFEQLCNEPVRKDYLTKCIVEYRPPKFTPGTDRSGSRSRTITTAKVWIIGGLREMDIPDAEEAEIDRVVKRASKKRLDFERSEVDYTHYPSKLSFFSQLREGDQLITCVRSGRGFDVWPPGRFLGLESYPRGGGKRRYLVTCEAPTDAEPIRWTALRAAVPPSLLATRRPKPRTTPIVNDTDADALLRLWDARGRFRPGRKT